MTPKREYDYLLQTYVRKPANRTLIMSKILNRMKKGNKHWWFAYEFADIQYKATQRVSDLVNMGILEVEKFKHGLKVYKLKSKKLPKWAVDN